MSRENDRRDKALESIDRHLGTIEGYLKTLAENSKKRMTVTNHIAPPDPFKPSGEPEPVRTPEKKGYPEPTHPYLMRSDPPYAPGSANDTGPYGTSSVRPYE